MRESALSSGRGTRVKRYRVQRLAWSDPELGGINLPKRKMEIRGGFGSGLSIRHGEEPGRVWAVGDRGPNIKVKDAVERYGLKLDHLRDLDGAKVMPRLDVGPAVAELRVVGDAVEMVRSFPLLDRDGKAVSGLPIPGGVHSECEPALDLQGRTIEPDPSGVDTEGLAATADGFWVGDEYGPSLLRLNREGRVQMRWIPAGCEEQYRGAAYPVAAVLPAIAAKRQINRGFEALSLSPDQRWLYLAFQSPLAHPDEQAHERGRHVRLWRIDSASGAIAAQYLYPLDLPASFERDNEEREVDPSDLKVSEITEIAPDIMLVLERASKTTKIYKVRLDAEHALPEEHLDMQTRPTVEELSASGKLSLPVLEKELLFSTDQEPEVAPDLEGMAVLSPTELLLVNDNDFGLEGAETSFWRVTFDEPVLAG